MRNTLGVGDSDGRQMGFVPLTCEWGRDGAASVVVAALEDAGFHPEIECDPRGWMHFYGWPFGSASPVTIWVPSSERDDAAAFLEADCNPEPGPEVHPYTFGELVWGYRRWIYVAWLLNLVSFFAVVVGLEAAWNAVTRNDPLVTEDEPAHA